MVETQFDLRTSSLLQLLLFHTYKLYMIKNGLELDSLKLNILISAWVIDRSLNYEAEPSHRLKAREVNY